jgi:predicted metalloprotease
VKRVISRVELQGDRNLRQVLLYEEGGDWTRIQFHDLQQ